MKTLTRRHVLASFSGATLSLCPAILNAQNFDWGGSVAENKPTGETQLAMLPAGPARVDISILEPGEVAVVGRPTTDPEYSNTDMVQYVGVTRRTEAQIAFGQANDRPGTVQDPRFFAVNLVCPHRGKAIGMTGNPATPFACTDQGRRHGSIFDASGLGTKGASEKEFLSIPSYSLEISGSSAVLLLA